MNIGQIVGLVTKVGEDLVKVPAIVTKVYENAHGEVVADLHQLEATVKAVISQDDNPPEAIAPEQPSVTADLASPPSVPTPPPAAEVPDAALGQAEKDTAALDDADYAAFKAWQAEQAGKASATPGGGSGDGSPS